MSQPENVSQKHMDQLENAGKRQDAPRRQGAALWQDAPRQQGAAQQEVASKQEGTSDLEQDQEFMREALAEAHAAAAEGEVPIGAVVVYQGEVIARAHNRRELDLDPSAHAEFRAMLDASRALGRWRLTGCTVYVTVEPCLMCAGLMINARIDRCVYGGADPKGGALGSLYDVSHDPRLNHEFDVTPGVLVDECAQVMRDFFRARREQNKRAKKALQQQ